MPSSRSRAFYREVLDGSPEPMLVSDEAGVIRYANLAAARFYQCDLEGLLNLPVARFLPAWFALPASCRDFPTQAVLPNGYERAITLSLAPVQTNGLVVVVAVFRDSSRHAEETQRVLASQTKLQAQVNEGDTNLAQMRSQLSQAAAILENHLPSPTIEGVEVSWFFEPSQTLGGDMIVLRRYENKLILGMLDVSGHGVAASMLAIGMARTLSPERGRGGCVVGRKGALRKPMDVVTRLNQDSHALFESGLFVTLLFGVLDLSQGELCFTCAGHPLPIRVWQSNASEVQGMTNPPLGVERYTPYCQTKVMLRPGELLVLYTDGVTESRSPAGQLFGEERLLALTSDDTMGLAAMASKLSATLVEFRGGVPAADDASFLAIRMPS